MKQSLILLVLHKEVIMTKSATDAIHAMQVAIARLDVLIEAIKPIKELSDKIKSRSDRYEPKN